MIIIENQDFDLEHTFTCGQCFRWKKATDGGYIGVAGGKALYLRQEDGRILIDASQVDFDTFWKSYFDLDCDYSKIKAHLAKDAVLKKAIAAGSGIRILRQQPWETLISFIISANNNIPRIQKIINGLCEYWGTPIFYRGEIYKSFPEPERIARLTEEELSLIRCGYRAPYILEAARAVASGQMDLDAVYDMPPKQGRMALKSLKGVGDKVADCVLLFGYQKYSVFPKDVWIKRILSAMYQWDRAAFDQEIERTFGPFGGYAQQYLFYYGRDVL